MKHPLPRLEADILVGAIDEIADILAKGYPSGYGFPREKIAHNDASAGRVRCNPAWSGLPMDYPAVRMRVSRAYLSLQKRGLIVRCAEGYSGSRVTHVEPTDEGRAWAEQLRAEAATDA